MTLFVVNVVVDLVNDTVLLSYFEGGNHAQCILVFLQIVHVPNGFFIYSKIEIKTEPFNLAQHRIQFDRFVSVKKMASKAGPDNFIYEHRRDESQTSTWSRR